MGLNFFYSAKCERLPCFNEHKHLYFIFFTFTLTIVSFTFTKYSHEKDVAVETEQSTKHLTLGFGLFVLFYIS